MTRFRKSNGHWPKPLYQTLEPGQKKRMAVLALLSLRDVTRSGSGAEVRMTGMRAWLAGGNADFASSGIHK